MKKILLLCAILLPCLATAQFDPNQALPFDPSIKQGKLANGLTYYIKKNAKPEKRAELRLAINAGSLQEDPDQLGLAHFCEHLCFNGTKKFPKNALVDYLESIGTKFGPHLNAYTSFDETVYMLQIPTDNYLQFYRGFEVLEEWAHNVTFDTDEINKERGVVVSERRNGLGAGKRMFDKIFPLQMNGSLYADRLPIGTLKVLENFEPSRVKQFYKDWYRPELMSVIAVGDFDVAEVERIIKERFSAIPASVKPRPRDSGSVRDHDKTIVAIASDPEASQISLGYLFKHPSKVISNYQDYYKGMIAYLCNEMLNSRFEEIRQQPNPPFTYGYAYYGSMVRVKNNFAVNIGVTENNIETGFRTMFSEVERLKRHGFIESELARAKKNVMKNLETTYNERDKTESANYTYSLVDSYLEGSPCTSIEFDYDFYKNYLKNVSIEDVNQQIKRWITDGSNSVITFSGIEKKGLKLPMESDIMTWYRETKDNREITPYKEEVMDKELITMDIPLGTIKGVTEVKGAGITELKFANGAKVILKPSNFKNDEIQFRAFSWGGSSLYDAELNDQAVFAAVLQSQSGVGDLSESEKMKYLSGKNVNIYHYISEIQEGFSGTCGAQDIETALQMIYQYQTNPRFDKVAFDVVTQQQKGFLENKNARPEAVFSDSISHFMAQYNPRRAPMNMERMELLDGERMQSIFAERFANAGDFTYVFVGSFDMAYMRNLVTKYIGGMNGKPEEVEKFVDLGIRPPRGQHNKTIAKGQEAKSSVRLTFSGDAEYSRQNRIEMDALVKLLSIKLREAIREEKGGTYGVGVNGYLSHYPAAMYTFNVNFNCAPERVEELTKTAMDVLENLKANGVAEKDLVKIKETRRRDLETSFQDNSYWTEIITSAYRDSESLDEYSSQEAIYRYTERLTSDDLKRLAQKYIDNKNMIKFTLLPEVKKP